METRGVDLLFWKEVLMEFLGMLWLQKSANNTFLSREGLSTAGGNISSGYNSTVFTNTNFSIYKPDNTYFSPDTVSNATYSGNLNQNFTTTGCKVTLSRVGGGSTWDKTSNTKEDFSVNCFLSTDPSWTAGTKFNCVVTSYNSGNGELTFDVTPTISGTCKFAIIVRSGQGTGVTSTTLQTNTFVVYPDVKSVILSSSTTPPSYEKAITSAERAVFFDKTLGGTSSTLGCIAKFRYNQDPALGLHASHPLWVDYIMATQPFYPNQGSTKRYDLAIDWYRWGYTFSVRPYRLWFSCGSYPENNISATIQLKGFTSSSFSGGDILYSGSIPGSVAYSSVSTYLNFNGSQSNTTGWTHFEIKNTSADSANVGFNCEACQLFLTL